jgi:lipopolysaccharide export LptBFGC system permease protein LptF
MDVEFWTAITRPFVTIVLICAVSYMAIVGQVDSKDYLSLVTVVVLFWFRERSEEKVQQQVAAQVKVIKDIEEKK